MKLSEAQSFLVKSSDQVYMVICDGYNHMGPQALITPTQHQPFPRLPLLQDTQETPKLSQTLLNGKPNGTSKIGLTTPSTCNYDNLRDIESDDSRLTSPDVFEHKSRLITPILNLKLDNSIPLQQNQLTDKSIMSNIMTKSMNESKSQSMFVNSNNNTLNTSSTNTPITSVRYVL